MAFHMTALLVCIAGLVLLYLLPRAGGWRPILARVRHRKRIRRLVEWRTALLKRPREGAERRRAVVGLCRVLATELRAGQPSEEALRVSVAATGPPVLPVTDSESLRGATESDPDLWALAYVAVCWEVAADTGAGLADVVDTLADSLTEQEEQRDEAIARTSGPRTTAMVLSGLPVVGVVMSVGLGGSPVEFLFTTPLGVACLVGGISLNLLGAWWTLRMLRGAVAAF